MKQSGTTDRKKIALVLSGGGARGAYEAGILHYIRTMLPQPVRARGFDIKCGASVGGINTAFMAATSEDPGSQGPGLRKLWEEIREEDIYRRDKKALWDFIAKSSRGIALNLFKGPEHKMNHFQGFLDTAPFFPYLKKAIPWSGISKSIRSGVLKAVSIVATNIFTGKMELFVEKAPSVKYTGEYIVHFTRINPLHALASAAIPIVFPTVMIDGVSYSDGGLRLNTPMSPAIQLGADSILVIGLHHDSRPGEKAPSHGKKGVPAALGQVLGRVMNSIFLDRIQYDIEQLERINRLIDWNERLFGKNYIEKLNGMLAKKGIRGDIANRGLKRLRVLRINPSENIGEIFRDCYLTGNNNHFSSLEKFLVRFLDINPASGNDFLSYLTFMPEYIGKLLELGFEDARTHHNDLKEFLDQ